MFIFITKKNPAEFLHDDLIGEAVQCLCRG